MGKKNKTERAIERLRANLGVGSIDTSPEIRTCYSFDATNVKSLPAGVVFPKSSEDVRTVVSICHEEGVKLIPRGAGTGFAGGTVPLGDELILSTEKMNHIRKIDREKQIAVVEAGVVNGILQKEVARHNLMFPPDPSSLDVATIGGNVAQDAGGPRALKYGVTRDYVIDIEAITCNGKLIEARTWSKQGFLWNPLVSLLVGSEGTLAVMTAFVLKLLPLPEAFYTCLAFFDTAHAAAQAVSRILGNGVLPAAIELMDSATIACVRNFIDVKIPRDTGCSLLIETDGKASEARESMETIGRILRDEGAIETRLATEEHERDEIWLMRRSISPSLARIAPSKMNEDVCVPRSRLPALVDGVEHLAKKYKLPVPTFGHAGDGNLHVNVMLDRRNPDEVRRAEALVEDLFTLTLDLGGTISGEHGIGIAKQRYLKRALGDDLYAYERAVKKAFDPDGIINPGKVIIP